MVPGSGCPVPESPASDTASAVSQRLHEGAHASRAIAMVGGGKFSELRLSTGRSGRQWWLQHAITLDQSHFASHSGPLDLVDLIKSSRPSTSGMLFSCSCVGSLRCAIAPRTLSPFRHSSLGLPRECCRTGGAMTFMLQCLFRRLRTSARRFAPALSGPLILSRFFLKCGRSFWGRQFYSRSTSLR